MRKVRVKKSLMITAVALAMSGSAAHAGENSCRGTVKLVGVEGWATIIDDSGQGCQFRTASKIGRRILATCPVRSKCEIALPLPKGGDVSVLPPIQTLQTIDKVTREK